MSRNLSPNVNSNSLLKKTEFIGLGSKGKHEGINKWLPIDILGSPLHPVELPVWCESKFSFILNMSKLCANQRDFIKVRQFMMYNACILVENDFLCSRLNHSNSLIRSLSKPDLIKL